jgi:cyclopropane fatty-acyl-phospholipid synthase-like methyltransferase
MDKSNFGSREVGLNIGLVLLKKMFATDQLHYGMWKDIEYSTANISQAQAQHSQLILDTLAQYDIKSILDIGCGTGSLASKLIQEQYTVHGVLPDPLLAKVAQDKTDGAVPIQVSNFETMDVTQQFDCALFSESFQYVDMHSAFKKLVACIKPGGYLLVCDFFMRDGIDHSNSSIGGGHFLQEFKDNLQDFNFTILSDLDITDDTAPTLDFAQDVIDETIKPIYDSLGLYLRKKYPLISKILRWKYRSKLEKIQRKYFTNSYNGDTFKQYKTYRLMLCQLSTTTM